MEYGEMRGSYKKGDYKVANTSLGKNIGKKTRVGKL